MEFFEHLVLEQAPLKPTCFYRYVDNTFATLPPKKPDEFLISIQIINLPCMWRRQFVLLWMWRHIAEIMVGWDIRITESQHIDLYLNGDRCYFPAKNGEFCPS